MTTSMNISVPTENISRSETKNEKDPHPMGSGALPHRAAGHTQSLVGALIKRPPDRCEARIGISGGNHMQMIALGDVVLYQNHRAISDRPYG